MSLSLALLAAQPAILEEEPWDALRVRIESGPLDVATFIERRAGCNHFSAEAGSVSPERQQQVNSLLKKLRCEDIETDELALRRAHHDKPDVQRLLDDTKDLMPW